MTEEQHFNIDLTVAVHEQDKITEKEAKQKIRDSLDYFDDLKVLMAQKCQEVNQ
jgi:hypothetical protein